jgi:hypothetical protein
MKVHLFLFALVCLSTSVFASNITPPALHPVTGIQTIPSCDTSADITVSNPAMNAEEEPTYCWNCVKCNGVILCLRCVCGTTECADNLVTLTTWYCNMGCCGGGEGG